MIKVTVQSGAAYEFNDADNWISGEKGGIAIYKGSVKVAEFSGFLIVELLKQDPELA